jgi:hypothetical protein
MNREDIIRMAREAGFSEWAVGLSKMPLHLERFAALVASAEREACAKMCEAQEYEYWKSTESQDFTPQDCADAIRARGQA